MNDYGEYITDGLGLTEQAMEERTVKVLKPDMLENFLKGEQMLGTIEPTLTENWFASPKVWVQRASELFKDKVIRGESWNRHYAGEFSVQHA